MVRRSIAAGVLVLCLLAPTAAWGGDEEPEEVSMHFSLRGSHGYRILVYATSYAEDEIERQEAPGEVSVFAIKGRQQFATYRAAATVTETGLEADLGTLGRIDLDLRMSGKEGRVRAPAPCNGSTEGFEKGVYRGTFEFRGEEGFTNVRASRIPVSPQAIVNLICSNQFEVETEELPPGSSGAGLGIELPGRNGGRVAFEVTKSRPDGRTLVRAAVAEKRRGIEISRGVEFLSGDEAFSYDGALSAASVDLPTPFSGVATYRRDVAAARRWTGSLIVDLPGRAGLHLVRPRMKPTLVPAAWSVEPPEFR